MGNIWYLNIRKILLSFREEEKQKYFEGWYFKQVSFDLKDIVSIIPGISINSADSHAFIQIIYSYDVDGYKNLKTQYYRFSVEDFKSTDRPFSLKIGNNTFRNEGIELNLNNGEFLIKGNICFSDFTKLTEIYYYRMQWGISYFPFMECYHDIISMSHKLKGFISVNNKVIDFNEGKGYIEKTGVDHSLMNIYGFNRIILKEMKQVLCSRLPTYHLSEDHFKDLFVILL